MYNMKKYIYIYRYVHVHVHTDTFMQLHANLQSPFEMLIQKVQPCLSCLSQWFLDSILDQLINLEANSMVSRTWIFDLGQLHPSRRKRAFGSWFLDINSGPILEGLLIISPWSDMLRILIEIDKAILQSLVISPTSNLLANGFFALRGWMASRRLSWCLHLLQQQQ